MYRRMNRLYLAIFLSFPLMGYSSGLFCPYSGHIEDTKSVEFASATICSTFFHKMTGLLRARKKTEKQLFETGVFLRLSQLLLGIVILL